MNPSNRDDAPATSPSSTSTMDKDSTASRLPDPQPGDQDATTASASAAAAATTRTRQSLSSSPTGSSTTENGHNRDVGSDSAAMTRTSVEEALEKGSSLDSQAARIQLSESAPSESIREAETSAPSSFSVVVSSQHPPVPIDPSATPPPATVVPPPPSQHAAPAKVKIHLVAVGSAPILKRTKFQIGEDQRFGAVSAFVTKMIKQPAFLYCSSSFCPSPDELLRDLRDCFALKSGSGASNNDELIVHYSLQEAWG